MVVQVINNPHHVVLTYGIYVDACEECSKNPAIETNVDWIQIFFADEYHDLKITQKLSAENTGYHSANDVAPNRDITAALDNLTMAATAYQRQVYKMMAAF